VTSFFHVKRKRGDKPTGFIPSSAELTANLNTVKGKSPSNCKRVYVPGNKIINKDQHGGLQVNSPQAACP
jgi:hypothetical protein